MSEVQSRPKDSATRGRGGGRGGRGGYAGRSGTNRRVNGDKSNSSDLNSFDDDGDVSQLRKHYGGSLDVVKGIFPDWSDADILYALQETEGDVEVTVTRISEGTISQWGEVSKAKKAPKTKAKELNTSPTAMNETSGNSRPSRGRSEGGRGGRGVRGSDRARGGRGRASAHTNTNGHRFKENHQLSVPTEESSGWGNATSTDETTTTTNEWGTNAWSTSDTTATTTKDTIATPKPAAPTTTITSATESASAKPKTWANILKQSTQPKLAPKPKEPVLKPAEIMEPLPPIEPTNTTTTTTEHRSEPEPEPTVEDTHEEIADQPTPVPAPVEPVATPKIVEPEVALLPPEDELTKTNLEQLPDESKPPTTATAASTAADSWDPRQTAQSAAVTPLSASQAQHQAPTRPVASGFAASALKATERPVRVPSYQRRLLEQEEAVRMPGNREVDRTAVQFGAFSLNGAVDDDIDDNREEAETRAQPPSDSPIQPRASLPPTTQPAQVPEAFLAPAAAAPKPVTSLPQPTGLAAAPVAPPTGPSAATIAQPPQGPSSTQAYGRFGQTNTQEPQFPPKPYDTFGQPPVTSAAGFDSFPAPAAASAPAPAPSTQAPTQPSAGAFSSAPSEYSAYYTADQQSRNNYNNSYYGGQHYGQQGQAHNEGPNSHQRPFGGYNASQNNDNLSQYPQSSRYGASAAVDAQHSGHNTPNPTGQTQQQQAGQNSGPQSNLHQQPPASGMPYGHPYYNSPFYAQYMNSYTGYQQGGYGGGPYGKGGLYGQPHTYGMSHQGPYDQSSPATSGFAQSSLAGRDNSLGSGIDNYGRAASSQSGAQGLGNSGFGGAHDAFARASSYQSQTGQPFAGPNAQTGSTDDLKPYGDTKAGAGPSPSLSSAARPGSATNNTPGQSGLPPPQSAGQGMGGYGGYPNHLQSHGLHGNQTGGSGYGLGGAAGQGHGSNPYGAYGGYGGNQGFGNYGARQGQGWGNNY